jgi:hypothetical protein
MPVQVVPAPAGNLPAPGAARTPEGLRMNLNRL